ncbi:MAG: WYL domain-containing protein [Fibrobacterota bacterium]|nr:MAG: WYL domain-containing protein [Fibrobacterota bacterium]
MANAFRAKSSVTSDAKAILQILHSGDSCQECLVSHVLGIAAKHTFLERMRVAGTIEPNFRILVHPGQTHCPVCKTNQRTVYTLAPSKTGLAKTSGSEIVSLEQDLKSFLAVLERDGSTEANQSCISVFGPLFIRTNWDLWGQLHKAIHDGVVLSLKYGETTHLALPLHLWWAQGSWYLAAHFLRNGAEGRGVVPRPDGFRSGLNLARISEVTALREVQRPEAPIDAVEWLGSGDWLFRNRASENGEAVVLLGSRLLHHFKERLRQGENDRIELWEFGSPLPSWIPASLPPSLVKDLRKDPMDAVSWYAAVSAGDDPQTQLFMESDSPAAIVRFPYPAAAMSGEGMRVGEFEAARKILSWGAEAVVLAPVGLVNRVRELARVIGDRHGDRS